MLKVGLWLLFLVQDFIEDKVTQFFWRGLHFRQRENKPIFGNLFWRNYEANHFELFSGFIFNFRRYEKNFCYKYAL